MKFNENIEKRLFELANDNYIQFSKKLNLGNGRELIGVKLPILRKLAKKLSKEYELDYLLNNINEDYYEEIILKGLLICEYKNLKWQDLEKYIKYYVSKITDWGLCDTFCCSLKITKNYLNEVWNLLQDCLNSDDEFKVRFALVMILNYYINDDYIERIYNIIDSVKSDKYYVKMANAWLISYCVVKYYNKTLNFLNNSVIDQWTYNKGIQKSIESLRVTKEQKEMLRRLKSK